MDLLTSGEIAKILGVSRTRVHALSRKAEFPEPAVIAGGRRLWHLAEVERWAETWDRTNPGGRPKQ